MRVAPLAALTNHNGHDGVRDAQAAQPDWPAIGRLLKSANP
jgi:hypothetical protein